MRTAIFALTPQGVKLSEQVYHCLEQGAECFVPARPAGKKMQAHQHIFSELRPAIKDAFVRFDALVFIMASGIVVRMIAPLLQSKLTDPAVVVLDEQGRHVISLLSGHVGGANSLTRFLAHAIHADPVITTATDVEGVMAPDAWASELGLMPWPKAHIKTINTALLAKEEIRYELSAKMTDHDFYAHWLDVHGIRWSVCQKEHTGKAKIAALITPDERPAESSAVPENILYLVPRPLFAGVGCRRGIEAEAVLSALEEACREIGVTTSRLAAIGSTVVKQHEQGLITAAQQLSCPLHFFANDELAEVIAAYGLQESPFVKKTIGIGNVCESAALRYAGENSRLALCKTKFSGVTVSLAWGNEAPGKI